MNERRQRTSLRVPDKMVRENVVDDPGEVSDAYLARQQRWLQTRDVDVVRFVHDWECASRDHIIDLFFPSLDTANRRLAKLVRADMLERAWLPRRNGEPNRRRPAYYTIGPAGMRLLRLGDTASARGANRERALTLLMAPHALAGVEFLVLLQRAAAEMGHRVPREECLGPRRLRREIALLRGREPKGRVDIVPDAYIVYERAADRAQGFFVEIDRGRERGNPFLLKASGYKEWFTHPQSWRHFMQGAREASRLRFPPVLVITTGERRMNNLIADVAAAGPGNISWYFTNWDRLAEASGGVLGKVWRKVPVGDFGLLDLV